jgi:hypothetical protein
MDITRSSLDLNRALQTNSQILSVLFDAKQKFEDIFLHWREPIAVLDDACNLFYYNHEWSFFCGVDDDHLRGQNILSVVDRSTRDSLGPQLKRLMRGLTTIAEFESSNTYDPTRCWKWTLHKHRVENFFDVIIIRTKDVSAVKAFRSEAALTSMLERLCRLKRDLIMARSLQDIGHTFFSNVCDHMGVHRLLAANLRVVDTEDHQVALNFADAGVLGRAVRTDNHPLEHLRQLSHAPLRRVENQLFLPLGDAGVAELVFDQEHHPATATDLDEFLFEACREASVAIQRFLQLQFDIEHHQLAQEAMIMASKDQHDLSELHSRLTWDFGPQLKKQVQTFGRTFATRTGLLGLTAVQHHANSLESTMFGRYLRGRISSFASVVDNVSESNFVSLASAKLQFMAAAIRSTLKETQRTSETLFVVLMLVNPRDGMLLFCSSLPCVAETKAGALSPGLQQIQAEAWRVTQVSGCTDGQTFVIRPSYAKEGLDQRHDSELTLNIVSLQVAS